METSNHQSSDDCSDDDIEVIEASTREDDASDDDDDSDDSGSKSEESDDPGDNFQLPKPVETNATNSNKETQMSFEDKANHLHQQFSSFPTVMIKRVLRREDVGEDLNKAIACLMEMKGLGAAEKQIDQSGDISSNRDSQEGMLIEANKEPYSLEEKVKYLKKEFKTFPPFLIRKVLNRLDINEDLGKAKTCLQEMVANKGKSNVGPEPNRNNCQNRGGRGRSHGRGWTNQGRGDVSNQNQLQSNNLGNQSQASSMGNQSQANYMGNQSQSVNTNNQSQSSNVASNSANSNQSNRRNRRNRNNRNRKQPVQPQQNQGTWIGHGSYPNPQYQYGPGYHGRRGGNQMSVSLPYGMHQQPGIVGPPYGSIPPLMGGPQYQFMAPGYPNYNAPNSRNEEFLHGFNQRNCSVEGHQVRRGPKQQGFMEPPRPNNQPNTIVLHGLNENTTFDNIRNFIEARTQELVLDIALSDDKKKAIITLEKISDFNKAKQRVSERQLDGANVSIEKVPICSSIIVTGLSSQTTRDGLDLYFCAKSRVDDIVSDIVMNEDHAIVTFKDPKAIDKVLKMTPHKLDKATLVVAKYYPFLHHASTQKQRNNNDIAVAVDPDVMAFITATSHNDRLSSSLQRLGFTLKHKAGENIAYITPASDKMVAREKGIEHMTNFIQKFSTFTVNFPRKHQEAVIVDLYDAQQEFGKEKTLIVEFQDHVKIVCLSTHKEELQNMFRSRAQAIQSSESKKTHQNHTIDVEEEKLAVLKKFNFIENNLSKSKFPDLEVQIDEESGKITINGPKKEFSEAKIKLYQYLAKMCEQQLSLSKTVIEMLSTGQGMDEITRQLKQHKINAVFCLEEGDTTNPAKTSVVGVSRKDADDAAELIRGLVSEVKIKVENENREVLKSQEWSNLCNKLKAEFQVHIRRNEYQDTWIAGLNDDVKSVHDKMQKFLEQNSIGTERFTCQDEGVRRYLLENRKDDLSSIEAKLRQFSVVIKPAEKSNEFLISGSKTGIKRACETLDLLTGPVTMKEVSIQQPGLSKFFSRGQGGRLVSSVEHEHRCSIQSLAENPTYRAHVSSPVDESDSDGGAAWFASSLQDGISSDDWSGESDGEDLFFAKPAPAVSPARSDCMTCGNVTISWKTGNIVNDDADILVGSILGQLAKAFQVQKSMYGSLNPGNIITIPPPPHVNQRCLNVILTHCAAWQSGNADQVLRSTVQKCLQEALQLNVQSIAFPVLGTAGLGIPKNDASRVMINEVINIVSGWFGRTGLGEVRFVVFDRDPQLVTAFQQEFATQKGTTGSASIPGVLRSFLSATGIASTPRQSGNVSVSTVPGDLLQEQSDAIVNIIGRDLNLSKAGKVSQLVVKMYPGLQTELTQLGPQSEGSVVITRSGRVIVHVVCEQTDRQNVQAAIQNCLNTANNHGLQSISLPAFGTGSSNMSAIDSAEATFGAIASVQQQLQNLQQIRIVIYKDSSMLDTFQHIGQQHGLLSGLPKVPKHGARAKAAPLSPKQSTSMSFRIYGRSPDSVAAAETSLIKGCSDSCKTQLVESEEVSKLSDRQRNILLKKANKMDVTIKFENRSQRVVVRGDSDDVASIVSDIWKEIQERSKKEKDNEQAKVLYKSVRWQYELNGQTAFFTKSVNATIEKAHVNKDKNVTVIIRGERLVVDLVSCKGFESSTGTRITLARTTVGAAKGGDISLPKEWAPMPITNGKEETVHLFPVASGSTEYQRVLGLFQSTGGRGNIIKIERIQNPHLYEQYKVHKKKMDKENHGVNNERQLFHGTSEKNLNDINKTGFNRSFCGAHGTAYGNGVYFARDASYSMGYAKPSGFNSHKHMYVARVLVGRYTQGHSGLIVAPKDPNTNSHYDSVANSTGSGASIFVVFHDARCYPEYLITFT